MHINCRRTYGKPQFDNGAPAFAKIWFYKWGFGIWLGRFLFGIGHDTRSQHTIWDEY